MGNSIHQVNVVIRSEFVIVDKKRIQLHEKISKIFYHFIKGVIFMTSCFLRPSKIGFILKKLLLKKGIPF